jgi:hypothetical protein
MLNPNANQELINYVSTNRGFATKKIVENLKVSGKLIVLSKTPTGGDFSCHRLRDNGTIGLSLAISCATEQDAWIMAAISLCKIHPGMVIMTSREFGSVWTANVLCPDGSLGMLEKRNRFEIRKMNSGFHIFHMTKRYLPGCDPEDSSQNYFGEIFSTIGQAADYIGRYISDYERAESEYRAEALEWQREQERDCV